MVVRRGSHDAKPLAYPRPIHNFAAIIAFALGAWLLASTTWMVAAINSH